MGTGVCCVVDASTCVVHETRDVFFVLRLQTERCAAAKGKVKVK
jgi:hypothetical protein